MVQHPERKPVNFIHLAWVLSSFLLVTHFWWWEINIAIVSHWSFWRYLFLIFYSSLFYFLCVLLFPDEMGEHAEYGAYFMAERKWIFGVLALISSAGVYDTLLKGTGHFAALGLEYPIGTAIYVVLCLVAMRTAHERFHQAFVILNLVYQVSWMFRMYRF